MENEFYFAINDVHIVGQINNHRSDRKFSINWQVLPQTNCLMQQNVDSS
jgi:hypothetical protein